MKAIAKIIVTLFAVVAGSAFVVCAYAFIQDGVVVRDQRISIIKNLPVEWVNAYLKRSFDDPTPVCLFCISSINEAETIALDDIASDHPKYHYDSYKLFPVLADGPVDYRGDVGAPACYIMLLSGDPRILPEMTRLVDVRTSEVKSCMASVGRLKTIAPRAYPAVRQRILAQPRLSRFLEPEDSVSTGPDARR